MGDYQIVKSLNNPIIKSLNKYAGVAQLVESLPSKQTVVGSSPIARSKDKKAQSTFIVD